MEEARLELRRPSLQGSTDDNNNNKEKEKEKEKG
jgi:hypothetical protein